jgi:hypothetical protein
MLRTTRETTTHAYLRRKKNQMPGKDGRLLFNANDMFLLGSKFRAKSR